MALDQVDITVAKTINQFFECITFGVVYILKEAFLFFFHKSEFFNISHKSHTISIWEKYEERLRDRGINHFSRERKMAWDFKTIHS